MTCGIVQRDSSSVMTKGWILTREIPKPIGNKDEEVAWKTCNGLVLSWIFNAIELEIATTLHYTTLALVAWKGLEDRFKMANTPQIYQTKYYILVKTQAKDSVSMYYTKLKTLRNQLDSCVMKPACTCKGCTYDAFKAFTAMEAEDRVNFFWARMKIL